MPETNWLYATAVLVALTHTVLGPDHYVPFVAMARAGEWSLRKTMTVTALCGVGHVLGSILLGLVGIALGIGVGQLEQWESIRGDIAGWMLLAFGLAYLAWGIRRALRNRPHTHLHAHADGTVHAHQHTHHAQHVHAHTSRVGDFRSPHYGGWALFTIFLFGPCEPLIPLLMYPAARENFVAVAIVTGLFSVTTIATMLALVLLGTGRIPVHVPHRFARYGHAAAGFCIALCGVAVQVGL